MRPDRRPPPRMQAARVAAAVAALSLGALAGCGDKSKPVPTARPASIVTIPGSSAVRVRLTVDAAKRIDLQTATMKQQVVPGRPQLTALAAPAGPGTSTPGPPAPTDTEPPKNGAKAVTAPSTTAPPAPKPPAAAPSRLTVPAAAVLYRPTGEAFVYVAAGTLEYERQPVVVDYVVTDLAVLISGPVDGTPVVTVGGAELLGAELGVGGVELG